MRATRNGDALTVPYDELVLTEAGIERDARRPEFGDRVREGHGEAGGGGGQSTVRELFLPVLSVLLILPVVLVLLLGRGRGQPGRRGGEQGDGRDDEPSGAGAHRASQRH
ncbi:hypothetical protein ADL12_00965 [Streptomyces regalis]|uniref:Uncharacterized protein n=1 Tax=Streptomyces regalis TaxID=68262 RepID=A0A0X3VQX2_9ACTN|nr:hypothetical protein ADL12_00965 [Streptomyces regalis]